MNMKYVKICAPEKAYVSNYVDSFNGLVYIETNFSNSGDQYLQGDVMSFHILEILQMSTEQNKTNYVNVLHKIDIHKLALLLDIN